MMKNLFAVLTAKFRFLGVRILILFLIFFSYNVHAQEINDELLKFLLQLEQSEKKVNTVKAEFVQIVLFESTGERQKIVGTVFLKKPDSIYINQKAPQEQRIYIDGKTITIYTPSESQAVTDSWKNSVNDDFSPASIVSFGSSWREIKKTNNIILDGYNNNRAIIKIQSLKNKNFNVRIYISKTNMLPEKAVVNSEGAEIELVFKSYVINPELAGSIFKFKAPNNIEIIKL